MSAPLTPRSQLATETGYWTSPRMDLWRGLTPEQRDYDRYMGWYPPGQGACETEDGRRAVEDAASSADHECRCHISPPCAHCVDCTECEEEAQR